MIIDNSGPKNAKLEIRTTTRKRTTLCDNNKIKTRALQTSRQWNITISSRNCKTNDVTDGVLYFKTGTLLTKLLLAYLVETASLPLIAINRDEHDRKPSRVLHRRSGVRIFFSFNRPKIATRLNCGRIKVAEAASVFRTLALIRERA
uniref:Uncharacterized protein n=1 Tax=Romanomermis culicivorax TaxID=13658 RepID=A0A915JV81_ROMCU